jgi:cholesterol oxidase
MLSLMWGTGWPALYSHENLADVTHRRGGDLYGATSMNYYRNVYKMLRAGSRPIKYDRTNPAHASLPDDYFAYAREIETPVLLTTGEDNKVFTDSNIVCYERLRALGCDHHELQIYPGYGHQDVFMGQDVARDCFPGMLDFIRRHSAPEAAQAADQWAAA